MSNQDSKAERQVELELLIAKAVAEKKIVPIQPQVIDDSLEDDFIAPPEPTDAMFYGIVGKVAETAADKTEVNPVAAATAFLSFLGANVGRDTYLNIGNTCHHPRIYTLHIGRSGRGRKGDSQQLTMRIRQQIEQLDKKLLGHIHTGGLSSKEGLASLIQDAQGDKTGTEDKRLWVIESEFSNVLHQTKRDGNTLSPSLRDGWDGNDIKPAVKNGRTWSSSPHIGIHGNITPNELKALLSPREMSNGFANRFLFIFAESTKEVAFPPATPEHIINDLVRETMALLYFAKAKYPDMQNSHEMSLSASAKAYFTAIYPTIRRPLPNEYITGLLERRAAYVQRLAMLFALTDQTRVIEQHHLNAALAWVNYATQSVRYIFQDQARSASDQEIRRNAEKIVTFLGNHPQGCTQTALANDCFKKHLAADKIQKALNYLLTDIPKQVERVELKNKFKGRPTTLYKKIVAEKAEKMQSQTGRGFEVV